MPTFFPQLGASAVITQRPYATSMRYRTIRNDMPTGRRHAYSDWATPLFRFGVGFPSLSSADRITLENFFAAREGRLGEFVFLDPSGNLVQFSEAFGDASWAKTTVTIGAAQTDPFGGSLAIAASSTGTNGMLDSVVVPDANGADAYVLCASVWANAQSANQQLHIGFVDAAFALLGGTTWSLPQGAWRRIYHTLQLATPAPGVVRILIGGLGTWNTTTIHLFGSQVVPTRGPGGYAKTPGNDGLHAKCRFDVDELEVRYVGPNHQSVQVPIAEYR